MQIRFDYSREYFTSIIGSYNNNWPYCGITCITFGTNLKNPLGRMVTLIYMVQVLSSNWKMPVNSVGFLALLSRVEYALSGCMWIHTAPQTYSRNSVANQLRRTRISLYYIHLTKLYQRYKISKNNLASIIC